MDQSTADAITRIESQLALLGTNTADQLLVMNDRLNALEAKVESIVVALKAFQNELFKMTT